MCSFRLYGIIRSHPREKYRGQDGGAARLDRGMTLWDLTYPQREYHAQLHTTCGVPGYRRKERGLTSATGVSTAARVAFARRRPTRSALESQAQSPALSARPMKRPSAR